MGITIAAVLATLIAGGSVGYVARRLSPEENRGALLLAALVMLPMSPLAFNYVRLPLDALVKPALAGTGLYAFAATFYAPLTEEPAKWLVLLVPWVRRALDARTAVPIALAAGLGFGLGEVWFLASLLGGVPDYAALPFWMFGGFIVERVLVAFLHGAFLVLLFRAIALRHGTLAGVLAGLALHYVLNLPIFLASVAAFGVPAGIWTTIASLWPVLMAIALGGLVNRLSDGRLQVEALGVSQCPGCGQTYPRPLLALNLGPVRYERCPSCRRFHLVPAFWRARRTGDNSDQS